MKKGIRLLCAICAFAVIVSVGLWLKSGCSRPEAPKLSLDTIPPFSNEPYVVLADNVPEFSEGDHTTDSYEYYSELDRFNRCGYTMACIGPDIMPTEERGSIGQVKPTGWHTVKYDFVDGKYLYNRCHLIGYQLTGENANERNLITGTRYMNVEGMLPFENMVADYVKETGNHVLYRVTPIFETEDMVAKGVVMEALSMEDNGVGICFNVFVYNNQPGVTIDYATGESTVAKSSDETVTEATAINEFLLNNSSKKFHTSDCAQGQAISEKNRERYQGTHSELIQKGYEPAGCCKP